MKKLLCKDLGGPSECTAELTGETFLELGESSKKHVMEMVQGGDAAHQQAIERMMNLSPEEQQKEFASYQEKFEAAPEN